jgi:hypothetical protein
MKLNPIVTHRNHSRIIQEFGAAKLVRHADGKHELIGGTTDDVAEANEWVSLFAHEIVFSRPGCKPTLNSHGQGKPVAFRFRSTPNSPG